MRKKSSITVRPADSKDTKAIFALGHRTPEFQTSNQEPFMEVDELAWRISHDTSIFLLAEVKGDLVGFAYSETVNTDAPIRTKFACLVYIVVNPKFRKHGIAKQLLTASERELKKRGMKYIFVWANQEGDGAIETFLTKQGYVPGHVYRWMDKKL